MAINRAVLTTKEIAETAHYFGAKKRNRYAIPVAGALQLPKAELPIPPYALGVWLGDGHSYGSQITCHQDDLEIADHLRACAMEVEVKSKDKRVPHILTLKPRLPWPDNMCRRGHDMNVLGRHGNGQCAECGRQFALAWKNGSAVDPILEEWKPFSLRLPEMGLVKDRKTPETGKHIPPAYLRASIDQRLALLQGLMDTDGYIAECGRCEFITVHSRLAYGFGELLASLGIKFSAVDKQPKAEATPDITAAHAQPGRAATTQSWGEVIARTFKTKG